MARWIFDLHLFEGDGAGAAPAAAGETAGEAAVTSNDGVLEDGTKMDSRLAARMEKLAQKRKARGADPLVNVPVKNAQAQEQPAAEPSLDDRWEELKKGEFKDQYGRDVQAAVQERFKNQKDANDQLKALEPMLKALRQKAGVETDEELSKVILDDDSLYEDAAEEAGMTVEAYKQFKALQEEHDARKAQEEADAEQMLLRRHFDGLARQAEEFKKTFPDFDLMTELQNETFRRLTGPNSGLTLEDAYYAVHHRELAPQTMAYGIERAKSQISKAMQANSRRPNEGAMQGGQSSFNVSIDPRSMTKAQREKINERVRRGEKITF
jgi:hypothetical protein